jgi:acetyl esterase/lipase
MRSGFPSPGRVAILAGVLGTVCFSVAAIRRLQTPLSAMISPAWVETIRDVPYGPLPENRLDIMRPRQTEKAGRPGVVVFHGGAWQSGDRRSMRERVCRRYLAKGFIAANVEYRSGIGPAAEDAVRALEWFVDNARSYGADPRRIVVTGESAGGHLALFAAFKARTPVAAVVNFYGISDLTALVDAPFVRKRLPQENPAAATSLSPMTYVRAGICPVLSIHGTADPTVPLDQSIRLTEMLRRTNRTESAQLTLIEGGKHGFTERELGTAYEAVFEFLYRRGVKP